MLQIPSASEESTELSSSEESLDEECSDVKDTLFSDDEAVIDNKMRVSANGLLGV